ncbi:MAG: hypothetical protein AVDCRST_MAG07-1105 [uncultured Frankineae bacterium]|uniref:Uncharacterized protein n=1 Tax=uncultured Frankineae bacterium TaxID=437475 RepID=A0A6J4L0G7_9ACTN|nr:MAG: hypothetical protein AVDCRST_MAG07-1105 [uncultured Frankineae bacterium]
MLRLPRQSRQAADRAQVLPAWVRAVLCGLALYEREEPPAGTLVRL